MIALKVDGICGQQTKKRTQKWLGVSQDGKIGPKTIKALQKRVGAKPIDGKFGKNTARHFQAYLNANGAKIATDGIWGKKSKSALQTYLNKYYHLDPKPAPSTKAQKLANMAKACAWPKGTKKSKYTYPGGSATAEFKAAIKQAYPDRSRWGKQTRAGASCDVFAGTCIRAAQIDTKFPRGLDDQIPHIKKSDKFTKVNVTSASSLKAGDVIIYTKKKGGGHICIYRGDGLICEAGYNTKRYGCTVSLAKSKFNQKYIKNTYKYFGVFRPKG